MMFHRRSHIAFFIPSLYGGGAEKVIVHLANGFAELGFRVDLVVVDASGPFLKEISSKIKIIDLGYKRTSLSILALSKYLRKENPKFLVSAMSYANVIALLAKKIANSPTKILVSEHSTLSIAKKHFGIFNSLLIPALMYVTYRKADAIVAVSNGVASDLCEELKISKDRLSVIYNPIVTKDLFKKSILPIEHPWIGNPDVPLILAAGRLTAAKDYPTLIAAFAKLRKIRKVRLIILGEGELQNELQNIINKCGASDDIELKGFVSNPYAWMSKCSLFVMSSAWEGFGNVLVEAMASGAKVVSTSCPNGPSEILECGKWGKLVSVGDSDALATSMNSALDDFYPPDVRIRAASFSVDEAVRKYESVLLNCADS